jgi:hypothetical protein
MNPGMGDQVRTKEIFKHSYNRVPFSKTQGLTPRVPSDRRKRTVHNLPMWRMCARKDKVAVERRVVCVREGERKLERGGSGLICTKKKRELSESSELSRQDPKPRME